MKNLIQSSLTLAITLSLAACGGSDKKPTPEPTVEHTKPTITNISDNVAMDLVGANGLIITGDTVTAQAMTYSAPSSKNMTSGKAPRITSKDDVTLKTNTAYKINPDGSLEEVDITAGGEDARGALKLVEINPIGDNFLLVVFEKEEVQYIIRDFVAGGDNAPYDVGRDSAVMTSYLVSLETGQARKANFLGSPILDYDENKDGIYQFRNGQLNDWWVSLDTTTIQRAQVRDNTYFDANGDMYTVSLLPDYDYYKETDGLKKQYRQALIKVNTSEFSSGGELAFEEINVEFTGDFITSDFKASKDGSFVFFYQNGSYSAYSVDGETVEKLNVSRLVHGKGDRLYGFTTNSNWGEVYTISTDSNQVNKTLLRQYDGTESYQIPTGLYSYIINGLLIIANKASYDVFDEKTGLVIGQHRDFIIDAETGIDGFIEVATKHALFTLQRTASGSNFVGWIPNTFTKKPLKFDLGSFDSAYFDIYSFDVTGNDEITFEATLLADLDDYSTGDKIIAKYNFLRKGDVQILDTINTGEPSISGVLGFSQGEFISIDGFAKDWNIDYRFITDSVNDTNSENGDISYVSMFEDDSDYWFLVEGNNELSSVMTTVNLNDTTSIRYNKYSGIYVDNGSETSLYEVNGISASFDNIVEFTLPKRSISLTDLDVSVTTHNRETDIDAKLFDSSIHSDTGEVLLDIYMETLLSATLTYEIFSEALSIENKGDDNYKVFINGSELSDDYVSFYEKHLEITLPSGTFSFTDIPSDVEIEMTSIPTHTDTLIDTAM